MIHLRALEAEIAEEIRAGFELHRIREQVQKKPYFRNMITRMAGEGISGNLK